MLFVVLPLGMGGVAVLQPFGPGREMVCIGQLWSDSTAVVTLWYVTCCTSFPSWPLLYILHKSLTFSLGVRNVAVVLLLLLSSHQLCV